MPRDDVDDDTLLQTCRERAIELLRRNSTPAGILAASPTPSARDRGYLSIFGRDAAICALGMAACADPHLQRDAASGLITLAQHQAPNGQIAKFVDAEHEEPDFWYLGCIDSTLWWLLAIADLDRRDSSRGLRAEFASHVDRALQWLLAQEHQRFFLLQQNEASDWADIMPRSGFVLYTNALWYEVKRLYGIGNRERTRNSFNGLFHPFSAGLAEYRRARLLADYVLKSAKRRELYLSFVNFSYFGEEGDVFGNVLAVLCGLAEPEQATRVLDALLDEQVHDPYPIRAVCEPILEHDFLWRPYMARHDQNFAWQYHNGGIWPMVGGFWIMALVACGRRELARHELIKLARACAVGDWQFNEWLHGRSLLPGGMAGQSWNAASFLLARASLDGGGDPFATCNRSTEL